MVASGFELMGFLAVPERPHLAVLIRVLRICNFSVDLGAVRWRFWGSMHECHFGLP